VCPTRTIFVVLEHIFRRPIRPAIEPKNALVSVALTQPGCTLPVAKFQVGSQFGAMAETLNIRLKPTVLHRAMLIDAQLERAHLFASFMADRGCQVTSTVRSVSEALSRRGDLSGTDNDISLLVFYATDLSAKDVKDIEELTGAIDKPLLVITESSDPQVVANAIAAGASFCQPLGVNADRLQSGVFGAIEVHKRLESLQKERDQAVQGLSERKLIDRAKAIVMDSRDLNEPDAFAYMQKLSMTRNTPLAEIARSIIAAKDLLG